MSSAEDELNIEKIDPAMHRDIVDSSGIKWYSPLDPPFRLAGFPWIAQDRVYRRLPVSREAQLPRDLVSLAACTAGGQIGFRTDSTRLVLKVELAGKANMYHMPATGQCGFDCYIGGPGHQVYCSTTRYDHLQNAYECPMFDTPELAVKDVTLNFPLYQGVKAVWIGLDPEAAVAAPLPYMMDRPVIIYGTSITQGGCAARPGMAYTNILSRKMNLPVVNLGFSGNGKGEPEVARLMAEIPEPACLVLDYEANARSNRTLENTLQEFIRILRAAHAQTPILVISQIRFAKASFFKGEYEKDLYYRDFQAATVERFRQEGDMNIHFCDGLELLGADFAECTVDGCHPTDLGFWKIAEKLAPLLRRLIF